MRSESNAETELISGDLSLSPARCIFPAAKLSRFYLNNKIGISVNSVQSAKKIMAPWWAPLFLGEGAEFYCRSFSTFCSAD